MEDDTTTDRYWVDGCRRRMPRSAKVRCSADWERVDVEWSLLNLGRVVGDERERAEMDLVALNQNSA